MMAFGCEHLKGFTDLIWGMVLLAVFCSYAAYVAATTS